MVQHRYRTAAFLGRWHPTRRQACQDALRAGVARPGASGRDRLIWLVPGEIETMREVAAASQLPFAFAIAGQS